MSRRQICISVYAALFAVASLSNAQQPRRPQPAAPPGGKVLRDLPYVENGHERQKLDLYLPERATGPLPLIVWIHGGGWQGGNKNDCPAVPFVSKGFAAASINYRLSQHATFPAQIDDCKAAIRWLRAHASQYQLDPNRIGVWGASAGGHLVALLGTTGGKEFSAPGSNTGQSDKVQAVCDWFGPTDFLHWPGLTGKVEEIVVQFLGGPVQANKDKAAQASPITFVVKGDPPFLIMHGDQDPLVPLAQSERFAEALKKAGVEVTLRVLKGAGHGGPAFSSPENRQLVEEFFVKHLKKSSER